MPPIERAFLDFSIAKLRQYTDRIQACVDRLSDDEVWSRGHATENSIGNLCLHLAGNVRQWIVASIGDVEDTRDRDSEFAAQRGMTRADLMARLKDTVEAACRVIAPLTVPRLEEPVTIQGYHSTILQAVYQVVEHFALHTGQIVFATKALTGEDLGFYRHLSQKSHSETTP